MAEQPITYREYQSRLDVRPPWHGGAAGDAWHGALGTLKDGFKDLAYLAAYSRWVSTCPDDALAHHGNELGWPRTPHETVAEYRARLLKAPALEEVRGTRAGIVDAFASIGMPNVQVFESFTPGWGRHRNPGPGITATRARWINVVLRAPHPFGGDFAFRYGDGTTYGSGAIYGPDGDPRLIPLIRQLVRRQKPAHTFCEWIAVVLAGDIIHTNSINDGNPDGSSARVAFIPV